MSWEVKLNKAGVRQVLQSEEVAREVSKMAYTIRDRCGDGYTVRTGRTDQRAFANVEATTFLAKRDNHKNNTLLKARGGN